MKSVANSITTVVVFCVLFFVIFLLSREIPQSLIYAAILTMTIIVIDLYLWQPGEVLGGVTLRTAFLMFGVYVLLYIPILLIVSLIFAHLNPLVPSQWHKISIVKDYFGVALIITGGFALLPASFATLVRALLLELLPARRRYMSHDMSNARVTKRSR